MIKSVFGMASLRTAYAGIWRGAFLLLIFRESRSIMLQMISETNCVILGSWVFINIVPICDDQIEK